MHLLRHWALLGVQLHSVLGYSIGSPGLVVRQDPSTVDVYVDNSCRTFCTPKSCNLDTCPLTRRDVLSRSPAFSYRSIDQDRDDFDFDNYSYNSTARHLFKRAFTTPINQVGQAADYVRGQFLQPGTTRDIQFDSPPDGFFIDGDKKDKTVSYQAVLGTDKLQWGTGGLHGCTMMFIVSTRAVWMAHFWEIGAFCGYDDFITHNLGRGASVNCRDKWNNEVIRPVFTSNRPNVSQKVTYNLFNQPGDNTRIIFMTPKKDNTDEALYTNKIDELVTLITRNDRIPDAQVETYYYPPLNYDPTRGNKQGNKAKNADFEASQTTERGYCLFQYDGVSNWRLFYESYMTHN